MIYLDYAATTPVHPEVIEAMQPFFAERYGNPSSLHVFGQQARKGLEAARETVAAVLGARPQEIVFTGGGSESDNLAIAGVMRANATRGRHLIISAVEHSAVTACARALEKEGFEISVAPVSSHGALDLRRFESLVRPDTVLVSVMLANNETGVIQPIRQLSDMLKARGVLLHTDAVQGVGKIPAKVNELGVDLLSLSAHKIYGPKGIGALFVRAGTRIEPIIHGGHHEHGLRGGTAAVPLAVGLAKALELVESERDNEMPRLRALRDMLETELLRALKGVVVNGKGAERLPQISNMSFEGVNGERLLLNLDAKGVAVSTGAACTTGVEEPSHVLTAMGLPRDLAFGSVRFSLGKWTTDRDIRDAVDAVIACVRKLRES